jgi:hypothetical protein
METDRTRGDTVFVIFNRQGEWETRFWIRPTSIGVAKAELGFNAAQESKYKARQSIVVRD